MNIALDLRPWAETGKIRRTGHHSVLFHLGAEDVAPHTSGASAWTPVVGTVALIGIACIGWWLARRYRREDHRRADDQRHDDRQREDLAFERRLLEAADLQMRMLSRLEHTASQCDLTRLQELQARFDRVADRGPGPLRRPFAVVGESMDAYIATAVPTAAEAMVVYYRASGPDEVPMDWDLATLLKCAERQGRAATALVNAIEVAEQAVGDMCAD
ncbi:hypothetical protein ABZV77_14935 [Streptomyces sp. NPDC004732]|uniref:hypothetical protein n=1 Tax=Streptomyces sp. NPDC004732 TaxID=3154290 RepID=UPI0033B95B0F